MNAKFLNSKERKSLIEELRTIYGIEELPKMLLEVGKQKIRGFSGNMTKEEIFELNKLANVEVIGLYLLSKRDKDPRLNFDAVSLLKNQIKKSIIQITQNQYELWMRGKDLEIQTQTGMVILQLVSARQQKCEAFLQTDSEKSRQMRAETWKDLVGCGTSNGNKIYNFIPKERQLKTPLPK
jgi:NOL1/NOP2/fmu family ribosome biogenesis protein